MQPIFADMPDWVTFAAISIGAAATWLVNQVVGWRKTNRDEKKEVEKGIVDHQSKLIERQGAEIDTLRERADVQGEELKNVYAYMQYLVGILESQGVKFRPFNPDSADGSGLHRPLKETAE